MDHMTKSQHLALETLVTYALTGYMLILFIFFFFLNNDLNKVSIIQICFNCTIKSFQNMPAKLKLSELKRIKNSEVR